MPGPLEGVRVFDLTLFMVGPWAGMQLGAMGADVIHVEEPGSVHNAGIWVPPMMQGTSIGYIVWNLNKRSLLLDLKQEHDREIAHRLIETSDVFLENMRPGAADKLGMSYETLAELNPGLVYVSASGYGRRGPMADTPANDPIIQCFGGWTSINGSPGGKQELYRHHTQMDATTGNCMAQAALLGLIARDRTGKGQRIDVPMMKTSALLQGTRLAEYFATGEQPPRLGSACVTTAPHQAFRCQDQQYVAVGVVEERQWAPLCAVLGLPELTDDPRFATNPARVEHREELAAILEGAFASKPRYFWVMRLNEAGVPCSRFYEWDELRFHPQVTANDHVVQVGTPWGEIYTGGPPWKFSETPATMSASPEAGEHMAEILNEVEAGRGSPPENSR